MIYIRDPPLQARKGSKVEKNTNTKQKHRRTAAALLCKCSLSIPHCLPTHLINHSPLNSDVPPAFHSQVQCHTICSEPPPLERSHPQPNPEHPGPSPAADPVPGASARPHWILEYFFPFEHRPRPDICIIVICTTAGAKSRCSHMSSHIQLV